MIKIFTFLLCCFLGLDVGADVNSSTQINIQTEEGEVSYQLEVADTPVKREIGLMNRKNLPPNQGMLFTFSRPQIVNMWMKNTYIPLDMLFIDNTNTIKHIHQNAIPHNLNLISSRYPITKVVEINAGEIARHQIKTGQKISFN